MDYQFFPTHELTCHCGECGRADMDHTFMLLLVAMREAAGFAFPLSSAFRCEAHNMTVSSSGRDGPHTTGRAVDIRCSGEHAVWIDDNARKYGMTGKGIMQRGAHDARYIHLDDLPAATRRPRPWLWSY